MALAACNGSIVAPSPSDPALIFGNPPPIIEPGVIDPATDPEGDPNRVPTLAFVPAHASLRLLTTRQYQNSVRDLLGSGFAAPALGGFSGSLAASQSGLSPQLVEAYETGALTIAEQAFTDNARRQQLVGCDPSTSGCIDTYIRAFGHRVFRRPLSDEEVTRYQAVATSSGDAYQDAWKGAQMVLAAMLQSPNFIYRVELGVPTIGPTDLSFTDAELASRISYALWNSTPDEELLGAVSNGTLADPAAVRLQVRRLLSHANASQGIEQFLIDWLNIDELSNLQKNATIFPQFTPELSSAMREELVRSLSGQLLQPGVSALDLFEARDSYVNEPLAALYGITGITGSAFQKVRLPDEQHRGGVLGKSGLMAIQATSVGTSPVGRGHLLRLMMMCQTIAPPKGLVPSLPAFDPSKPTTNRQRLESHRSAPVCAGCHAQFDPIGLGLERFDAIGAFRTKEAGLDIDMSGTLEGEAFTDELGLNRAVRGNVRTPGCFVRQTYRYVTGHIESANEEIAIYDFKQRFSSNGYQFGPLLEDIVSHPSFRLATAPQ
jgi:hypothetical protein